MSIFTVILFISTIFAFAQTSECSETSNKSTLKEIKSYLRHRRYMFSAIGGGAALFLFWLLHTRLRSHHSPDLEEESLSSDNNVNEDQQVDLVITNYQEYIRQIQKTIEPQQRLYNYHTILINDTQPKDPIENLINAWDLKNILNFKNHQANINLEDYSKHMRAEALVLAHAAYDFPLETIQKMPLLSPHPQMQDVEIVSKIPMLILFAYNQASNKQKEAYSVAVALLEEEICFEYELFKDNKYSTEEIANKWIQYFLLVLDTLDQKSLDFSHFSMNQFVIFIRMFFCEHAEPAISDRFPKQAPLCIPFSRALIGLLLDNKDKNQNYINYLLEFLYPMEFKNSIAKESENIENYFTSLKVFYNETLNNEIDTLKQQFLTPKAPQDPNENKYHSEKPVNNIIDWFNSRSYHLQQTEINCCDDYTKLFYLRFPDITREIGKILWKTFITQPEPIKEPGQSDEDVQREKQRILKEKFDNALNGLPYYKQSEALGYFLYFFMRNLDLYVDYFIDQKLHHKKILKKEYERLKEENPGRNDRNIKCEIKQEIKEVRKKLNFLDPLQDQYALDITADIKEKISFIKLLNTEIPYNLMHTFKNIDLEGIFSQRNDSQYLYEIQFHFPNSDESINIGMFKLSHVEDFHKELYAMLQTMLDYQLKDNLFISWNMMGMGKRGIDWTKSHFYENVMYLKYNERVAKQIEITLQDEQRINKEERITLENYLLYFSNTCKVPTDIVYKNSFQSYRDFILFNKYSKTLFRRVITIFLLSNDLNDKEKSILLEYCFYNKNIIFEIFRKIIHKKALAPCLFLAQFICPNGITQKKSPLLFSTINLINKIIRNRVTESDLQNGQQNFVANGQKGFIYPFIPLSYLAKLTLQCQSATIFESRKVLDALKSELKYDSYDNLIYNEYQWSNMENGPIESIVEYMPVRTEQQKILYNIALFGNVAENQSPKKVIKFIKAQNPADHYQCINAMLTNKFLRRWLKQNEKHDNWVRENLSKKIEGQSKLYFGTHRIGSRIFLTPILEEIRPNLKNNSNFIMGIFEQHFDQKSNSSYDKKNHNQQKKNIERYIQYVQEYLPLDDK